VDVKNPLFPITSKQSKLEKRNHEEKKVPRYVFRFLDVKTVEQLLIHFVNRGWKDDVI
jgi:hypothetical protein